MDCAFKRVRARLLTTDLKNPQYTRSTCIPQHYNYRSSQKKVTFSFHCISIASFMLAVPLRLHVHMHTIGNNGRDLPICKNEKPACLLAN